MDALKIGGGIECGEMMVDGGHSSLRRRATTLAAAAAALKRRGCANSPFSLAFMTDRRRIRHPDLIIRVLPAGSAVVYRDYDDPARAATARALAALCRRRGLLFLIGGDPALAAACGAHGLHVPGWMRILAAEIPAGLAVTVACHGARDLEQAAALGAAAAFVSPVFDSGSHPGGDSLGPERFRSLAAAAKTPVIALGGVDETNAPRLAAPMVAGFGAIGAFAPR